MQDITQTLNTKGNSMKALIIYCVAIALAVMVIIKLMPTINYEMSVFNSKVHEINQLIERVK